MSRQGKAYLLTWLNGYGHSAVLIENGSADRPQGLYISFYPGDNLHPPSTTASTQSSSRSSTRSFGSGSRSTSGFGFKDGGFKTLTYDVRQQVPIPYACDEIVELDYEAMLREVENIRTRNYALPFYNCADAAEAILRAGGLDTLRSDRIVSTPGSLRSRVAFAAGARRRILDEEKIPSSLMTRFVLMNANENLHVPTRTGNFQPAFAPEAVAAPPPILKFSSGTSGYSSPPSPNSPASSTGLHAGAAVSPVAITPPRFEPPAQAFAPPASAAHPIPQSPQPVSPPPSAPSSSQVAGVEADEGDGEGEHGPSRS